MLSKFDYSKPGTLSEAVEYLSLHKGTRILAGGTDLMIMLRRNMEMPEHLLDIKSIPETKVLGFTKGVGLFIGASVTVNQIAENEEVAQRYPALVQAANLLASYQLRNRATLVGNICNASPGADLSTPLMIYDAKIQITSQGGNRVVDINEFFTGVKKTVLKQDELVVGITLPEVTDGDSSVFLKQARIKGHDLGIAGASVRRLSDGQIKIAMSAVAPTPIRLTALEEKLSALPLNDENIRMAEKETRNIIKPISDVRSSAEYRLHVSGVLVKRALKQLATKGGN